MSRSIKILGLLLWLAACARELRPSGPKPVAADLSRIETSVFLIGDAGEPAEEEPVLKALSSAIGRDPEKSLVLILGDNVYPVGISSLPGTLERREQERRLATQLDVLLKHGVRGVVVPGNHDWARHKPSGFAAVKAQEAFVQEHVDSFERAKGLARDPGSPMIVFLPKGGCPGPAVKDFGEHLRVLALDTQWWLHPYTKPTLDECGLPKGSGVVDSIRRALVSAGTRRTMVVAHHPIETGSEHGGFFDWKLHLFPLTAGSNFAWIPLPLLGSLYPLARQHGFTPQDISSIKYCQMVAAIDSAFDPRPPLLYAAGHDHGLQVFKGGGSPYSVVSGGGRYEKTNPVTRRTNSLLSLAAAGFMRVDIMKDDSPPRLGVYVVDSTGQAQEELAILLDDSAKAPSPSPPRCREQPGPPDMSIQVPGREY